LPGEHGSFQMPEVGQFYRRAAAHRDGQDTEEPVAREILAGERKARKLANEEGGVMRYSTIALLFVLVGACSLTAQAQQVDRAQLEKEIDAFWDQIRVRESQLLDTSGEDKKAHKIFLDQPDTELIRLLPRERYDLKHKLPIRGGGAYYSFGLRTHEYGRGSDISLERNRFRVGFAGCNFGFFVTLEHLSLEELTLEHPLVKPIVEYQPPLKENEIRAEYRQAWKGIKLGELTGTSTVPINQSVTYLLRSFNFDDTDVLVAFRLVRQDQDGSVVLLWKMLKKFPAPKSIRDPQN
jgi:hypothetical protein